VDHGEDPVPEGEAAVVVDRHGAHGAEVAVDQSDGRAPALVDGDAGSCGEARAGHRDVLPVDQVVGRIDRQRRRSGRTSRAGLDRRVDR
jgi:hypothetical protein